MGTCEVLLQISIVAHAFVKSLEPRIQLEGLVGEMNGILNVHHENEICKAWLGTHKVESAIIEQLTNNFKAIYALNNSLSAVTSVLLAEQYHSNELIICKSLELMNSCFLLWSLTDELGAVLLSDVVMNSESL